MTVFVLLTVFSLLGGSHGFFEEVPNLFDNLETELKEEGKQFMQVAEPIANSLPQTLGKAGTQLLTTAASDLLSQLDTGTTSTSGKRDLSEVVEKIGLFISQGEKYLNEKAQILEATFKLTLSKIQQEIEDVANGVKPISGFIDEMRRLISEHHEFVDDLVSKVRDEAMDLFGDLINGEHNKRRVADTTHSFASNLQNEIKRTVIPTTKIVDIALSEANRWGLYTGRPLSMQGPYTGRPLKELFATRGPELGIHWKEIIPGPGGVDPRIADIALSEANRRGLYTGRPLNAILATLRPEVDINWEYLRPHPGSVDPMPDWQDKQLQQLHAVG